MVCAIVLSVCQVSCYLKDCVLVNVSFPLWKHRECAYGQRKKTQRGRRGSVIQRENDNGIGTPVSDLKEERDSFRLEKEYSSF